MTPTIDSSTSPRRQDATPETSDHQTTVVVIGAGMAGLAAARTLCGRNYRVVVVEARDRVGGRIWTEDRIDLGAHWVHGTEGNPVIDLLEELNLPHTYVGGDSSYTGGYEAMRLTTPDGIQGRVRKRDGRALFDDVIAQAEQLGVQREQAGERLSIAEAVRRVLDDRDLEPWERQMVAWHLNVVVREDAAVPTDELSAAHWEDGYWVYGAGDSVLRDGYGALIEALATGIDVRLQHVVQRIEHDGSGVRIHVDSPRGPATLTGDYAIVTLPIGVLKAGTVTFDPPLPDTKQNAIERLAVACLNKVVLHYDTLAWSPDQYVFGHIGDTPDAEATVVVNLYPTHGIAALVLLAGGQLGRQLEDMTDEAARDWALRCARAAVSPELPNPTKVTRTAWAADPFARGTYVGIGIDGDPSDLDALAEPVGQRLCFAGEATNRRHWACVHSAYLTGLREAARITGDESLLPAPTETQTRAQKRQIDALRRFTRLKMDHLGDATLRNRADVLARCELFQTLSRNDCYVLASVLETSFHPRGTVLYEKGDPATSLDIIAHGSVAAFIDNPTNPIHTFGAGQYLGEYGMFYDARRTASVIAEDDTLVFRLEYYRFRVFLLAFPEALMALMNTTVARLVQQQAPSHAPK